MKLSIITINFNNKAGLQKTIDSIVSQTWRDFEWIVVDGGSTDGSKELIEKYAQQGCFAWWCSEPDKGVYNAMNKGIAHAKGEYLNFMNSGDSFHEPTTLQHVFDNKDFDADILYGDVCYLYPEKCVVENAASPLSLQHLYKSTIFHQSSFIRKELLEIGYNESLKIVSDWEKWVEWVLLNKKYHYLPLVIADMDTTGISLNNVQLRQKERELVIEKLISPCIVYSFDEIKKKDEFLTYNPELLQVYGFISKRRLYKRIVHFVIRILSLLDKILK